MECFSPDSVIKRVTGYLGYGILPGLSDRKGDYDETATRGTITPGALPAAGASAHPQSPARPCCGISYPTRGIGYARAVDIYAGVRTAGSGWQSSAFGRPARQGRGGTLLGQLVTHLSERDALRAEGTRCL